MDNGTLVYLKAELDDDRYGIDTKLRTGQIGYVSGRRGPGWVWVMWYVGPLAEEAAQCHPVEELGVIDTKCPYAN